MVRSEWVVGGHCLEQGIIDEFLGLLEVKLVGARFTDLLSFILEQIEEGL